MALAKVHSWLGNLDMSEPPWEPGGIYLPGASLQEELRVLFGKNPSERKKKSSSWADPVTSSHLGGGISFMFVLILITEISFWIQKENEKSCFH